jgi:integrase
MARRKPNGASSIYEAEDGWHGRVTVGIKDDGTADRRHVRGKSEAIVTRKVRALEKGRDDGTIRKAGQNWTVAKWLTHWLEHIAAPSVRDNTIDGYSVAVRVHLIPGLGAHRLERLQPEHIEKLTQKMQKNGSAAATAHQALRTLRTSLTEAVRRGYISRNAASLAKAPSLEEKEIEPYTVEEVQALLASISERRNRARWALALALGMRQGEVLGLKWEDVDLDNCSLRVRRGRLRPKYAHGCEGNPCGRKAGYCPQRVQTRADTNDTKSRAGRRSIGLPAEVVELLRLHEAEQEAERKKAAQTWTEGGWVFTKPTGEPLNPNTDYHEWKQILRDAGLRDGRLHDARHTAATVLLILQVHERQAMGVMGWATTGMAARYQHMTDPIRADIAKRVGGLIWKAAAPTAGELLAEPAGQQKGGTEAA